MNHKGYEKFIKNSVANIYNKAPRILEKLINLDVKNIAKSINLAEHIFHVPRAESFITLKYHKGNFTNNPICRLI